MSNHSKKRPNRKIEEEMPDEPSGQEQHQRFLHALRTILTAKKEDVDDLTDQDDEKPDYNRKFKLP